MLQGQTNMYMYMYVDLNACGRKHNVCTCFNER